VRHLALAVFMLAVLGMAGCGGNDGAQEPKPGPAADAKGMERARALRHIADLARSIETGLTTAPCGTDPLRAMGTAGCSLQELLYEHLYRSDWPENPVDGPYPEDAQERQAAVDVVCRTLPQLRALAECEDEEVSHNALAVLCDLRQGGPYAPRTCPPEWPQLLRAFEAELGQYVRLTSSPDPRVAEYAAELVFLVAPRSAQAWQIAERAFAGRGRLRAWDADRMIGNCDVPAHFTPLVMDAVLRGMREDERRIRVYHPFELHPPDELADRMRTVLSSAADERLDDVLAAVATPVCLDFLDDVLGILERHDNDGLRAEAANTLAAMGPGAARAVPALVRCLASDDRRLRMCALGALTASHVPSARTVDAVLDALGHADADDRSHAEQCIDALAACGAGIPAAQEALRRLATNPRYEVAKRARAALSKAAGVKSPR